MGDGPQTSCLKRARLEELEVASVAKKPRPELPCEHAGNGEAEKADTDATDENEGLKICDQEGKEGETPEEEGPETEKQKVNGCEISHGEVHEASQATAMALGAHAPEELPITEGGHGHGDGSKSPVCIQKCDKEVVVGPRRFTSSTGMLEFFFDLLHGWPLNHDLNKYEHVMLEDLLKKGHQEASAKIGAGIKSFQVRINPDFKSRCYHVVRRDGSIEGFSYRKCVDNLMPLPDHLKPNINITTRKGGGREGVKVPDDHKTRGPGLVSQWRGGHVPKLVHGRRKHGKGGRRS